MKLFDPVSVGNGSACARCAVLGVLRNDPPKSAWEVVFRKKTRSLKAARMLEQETGVEPARISLGS